MAKSISDTAKDRLANLKKTGGIPPGGAGKTKGSGLFGKKPAGVSELDMRGQEKKKVRKVLEEE